MTPEQIYHGLWQIQDRGLGLLVSFLAVKGIDLMKSPAEALRWCSERAEAGDSQAQYALAKLLWTGLAGQRDDQAAFQWCSRASEQGYLPATVMLSGFYSNGIGVPVNKQLSLHLLETAVRAGSSEAMSLLGTSYSEGLGIERDQGMAIQLWRSAAELGHAEAQCLLGNVLIKSEDGASEGVRWLQAAADRGNYAAHLALADIYEIGGAGLPEDKQRAQRHRAAAATLMGA